MHSTPSRGRLVALLLPLAAAGALVGLLTATWAGLWREPPTERLALVAALGMVPAIVRAAGLRHGWVWSIASVIVVAIVSLGAAVGTRDDQRHGEPARRGACRRGDLERARRCDPVGVGQRCGHPVAALG